MAATSATISSSLFTKATPVGRNSSQRKRNEVRIVGMNSYSGLKTHNSVAALGVPVCADQAFAQMMTSLSMKSGRGGVSCNAAGEIFQIVLVINGLTLVGVAVGFVLLRIEAFVEEAAE